MLRKRTRPPKRSPSPSSPSPPSPPSPLPLCHAHPHSEQVAFETGNPAAGAIISGRLHFRPCTATSSTLVLEPVPGLMSPADICMFVRPFADAILHFRPLRLATERNTYIVLVELRSVQDATNFATVFQGKPFMRGLVQETCSVREVAEIIFDTAGNSSRENGMEEREGETRVDGCRVAGEGVFPASRMFPAGNGELPACPVCLERMDGGIETAFVTTFCNHTMHAACLAQWDLNRCPVCRHTHELTPEASTCMNCNKREDLWMCVVCAYVGCGVYSKKHAHQHFGESQHPFAMNLEDNTFWSGEKLKAGSVWDYVSERFVNRLLTSDDGKIVEVSVEDGGVQGGASSSRVGTEEVCCGAGASSVGAVTVGDDGEDIDRGLQAAVYASRMDTVVDEYRARLKRMEAEHGKEVERLQEELKRTQGMLGQVLKEKRLLSQRVADAEKVAKGLRDKNGFLKSLNDILLRDKKGWSEEVDKMKMALVESETDRIGLKEQLRDLMMHLETQAKISGASSSDLIGGDVVVGPSQRQRLAKKMNRRTSGD